MELFLTISRNYVFKDVLCKMRQYIMLSYILDGVFLHAMLVTCNLVIMKLRLARRIVLIIIHLLMLSVQEDIVLRYVLTM